MTNENGHDGVIRINTRSDLDYEALVRYFHSLTPEQLRIATKQYNALLQAQLELLTYKTKEVQDALMQNLMHDQIPIETREREEELRKGFALRWSYKKIADEIGVSVSQVKRDLGYLGLHRNEKRK